MSATTFTFGLTRLRHWLCFTIFNIGVAVLAAHSIWASIPDYIVSPAATIWLSLAVLVLHIVTSFIFCAFAWFLWKAVGWSAIKTVRLLQICLSVIVALFALANLAALFLE